MALFFEDKFDQMNRKFNESLHEACKEHNEIHILEFFGNTVSCETLIHHSLTGMWLIRNFGIKNCNLELVQNCRLVCFTQWHLQFSVNVLYN